MKQTSTMILPLFVIIENGALSVTLCGIRLFYIALCCFGNEPGLTQARSPADKRPAGWETARGGSMTSCKYLSTDLNTLTVVYASWENKLGSKSCYLQWASKKPHCEKHTRLHVRKTTRRHKRLPLMQH